MRVPKLMPCFLLVGRRRDLFSAVSRISTQHIFRRSCSSTTELPAVSDAENLARIRHSAAHVLAMAVQRLFPKSRLATGPFTETGFYYDFLTDENGSISSADLKAIKKEMDRIVSMNYPITKEVVSMEIAQLRLQNEPLKLQLLETLSDKEISFYHIGDQWSDLCKGPHVNRTGDINAKAIRLEAVSGAYWRGNSSNPMLQRIYGIAWETPKQLEAYTTFVEEARSRDHRLIGQQQDLFSIQESAGGGLVFWHAKGSVVRHEIESYWKSQHKNNGYEFLHSPHIADVGLWKTSGHFDFYRADMFNQIHSEEGEYQLKPMNCPFHCLVYKNKPLSYRDLPIRWAELGTVYRHEKSGALHGLFRVRGFTQDDAHIFCLPEQLEDEIVGVLNLTETILSKFGFTQYDVKLSTRPKDSVGSDEIWKQATDALENALSKKGWKYSVDEGGGAFYGPKIDVKIRDAIGRFWQCSTIQCDFNLPDRFDLEYVCPEGTKKRPIMIHRAIFGSLERFFGVLIESTKGDFPFWLAPEQVRVIPVTQAYDQYAKDVLNQLTDKGFRAAVDKSCERLPKMIRNAETAKVPVIVVVGGKEEANRTAAVRLHKAGSVGLVSLDKLLELLSCAKAGNKELQELFRSVPETA